MRKFNAFLLIFLLISGSLFSQQADGPIRQRMDIPLLGVTDVSKVSVDFQPTLEHLEMPMPGSDRGRLEARKRALEQIDLSTEVPQKAARVSSNLQPPSMARNFEGNSYNNRIPNDNDLAISNDGKLISVINSTIWMWDVDQDTLIYNIGLEGFSSSLNIPNQKFDPRVMYDPDHDRFIVCFLRGSTDTTSYIMLAFSQTNDPSGSWNFYALPGSPLPDNSWTDFPMMTITRDEFIVTGNLIGTGEPWQTGFRQTLIWQIDKEDGYNGDTLTSQLWSNIFYNGAPIRNLRPVKGGSGLKGPNTWFLSNRNFDQENDSVFIVELTDTIGGNDTVLVNLRIADTKYGLPNNADQKFAFTLATNDARFLSAYEENGKIQFAGNSRIMGTNRVGIYHGIVDLNNNLDVTGEIVADSVLDFGYPNLAYTGNGPAEDDFILAFLYTDDDSSAGTAAMYYDGATFSPQLVVKPGDNFISISGFGSNMRWGDYTGIQRVYDEPGKVWFSGLYGTSSRRYGTWIAELGLPLPVEAADPVAPSNASLEAYPNPSSERVFVEFELETAQNIDISLLDMSGKVVKVFIQDKLKAGTNRFSILVDDLPRGLYLLRVADKDRIIATEKIIKQ